MPQAIDTWLITGFRGAGKSAVIESLARQRPPRQRFANLSQGITPRTWSTDVDIGMLDIESAAPGCPCCTGLLPFRVTLTRLLRRLTTRPELLLIESDGEGHVANVKATLAQPPFAGIITLAGVLAVVDLHGFATAGEFARARVAELCASADLVVANKDDLASPKARTEFAELCLSLDPARPWRPATFGSLPLECLGREFTHG